jgi:glycosyltransferase involved in cell wall biosynthesis
MPKISIIIPCYFNECNIPVTVKELLESEKSFSAEVNFEYVMIDDGSEDNTLEELRKFKKNHPEKVKIVKLSGNFGSYNAILAGMEFATGDCNVVISADLQDPPSLIVKMYDYWTRGIKLVLANREQREDNFLDKQFSNLYHRLIRRYGIKNMPSGGFDFCLFDKKLKEEVLSMREKNTNTLFLLVWLKYDYISIPYRRVKREIGKSRWTLQKKIKLLVDSFVSFSFAPIRLITILGFILGIGSLCYAILIFIYKILDGVAVPGWSALMVVLLLVSGFIMISIGILGEYLWRILDQVRSRPIYVIDDVE